MKRQKPEIDVVRRQTLKQLAGWAGASFLFWTPRYKTAAIKPVFAVTNDVAFSWSGAMTTHSIRVIAYLTRPSTQVRLVASLHADLSDPVFSETAVAPNLLVRLSLEQLMPNRRYYYAIEVDGVIDTGHIGRFHTTPARWGSFKFACSSCAQTGSTSQVFETIRSQAPNFFLHMGDMHYENIGIDDPTLFQLAYHRVWASPVQAALYRDVPLVYTWDDHDYGMDGSDKTSPSRTAARIAYQATVPHFPLAFGEGDVPIYQAFTVGRVRFLLTDGRSKRIPVNHEDNAQKTLLGFEQKSWLKNELLAAQEHYALTIWVNSVPWIDETSVDGWARYQTERRELADFIQENGIDRLLMVSGDAHMIAIDDGRNNQFASSPDGPSFPVFHAAALDSPPSHKGGPYSHGFYSGQGQFGLVEIIDFGGNKIQVKLTGLTEAGTPRTQYIYIVDVPPRREIFLPTILRP